MDLLAVVCPPNVMSMSAFGPRAYGTTRGGARLSGRVDDELGVKVGDSDISLRRFFATGVAGWAVAGISGSSRQQ